MKQLLQSLKDGSSTIAEVPAPRCGPGMVLVRTSASLVSAGTERMLVEFGKGNLFQKARQQPDKVRMVLEKARTDGVAATYDAVSSKLDQPLALGYCNVGTVLESRVEGLSVGDRVVSNGSHAELVAVPKNLSARIPDNVDDRTASFTVLAAIGLQGIRLAKPTLGESIVVTGLGLIGLLTVQMLRAQGCRVLGIDFDPARLALARQFGAETVDPGAGEDVLERATAFSRGQGVDAVIITASTRSNEPVSEAAKMCRKRGRIVLVGVVGLELIRDDFYQKELSFQVSCSYGPGRYDPSYEESGNDYPIGFVRWTEKRNFEAVLDLMSSGGINIGPLITHEFPIEEGAKAMELLTSDAASLGIVLTYPQVNEHENAERTVELAETPESQTIRSPRIAFLGAGNHAGRVLIPAFKAAGANLHSLVSAGGVSSVHFGKKYGFAQASTDAEAVLADPDIDAVVIATRHDLHASQVIASLKAGKHVYCEKPLCLTESELSKIERVARSQADLQLMVGFNRRFSPHVHKMKDLLERIDQPKCVVITVNAGEIPPDHWTQDPLQGGGRIIGEACHFIDLARHLVGAPVKSHSSIAIGEHYAVPVNTDKVHINIQYEDGSIAAIQYLANGHKSFPKERVEVFAGGKVLQLDNFIRLRGWGWPDFSSTRTWRQDKGVKAAANAFIAAIDSSKKAPITLDESLEASRVAIEVMQGLGQ